MNAIKIGANINNKNETAINPTMIFWFFLKNSINKLIHKYLTIIYYMQSSSFTTISYRRKNAYHYETGYETLTFTTAFLTYKGSLTAIQGM